MTFNRLGPFRLDPEATFKDASLGKLRGASDEHLKVRSWLGGGDGGGET